MAKCIVCDESPTIEAHLMPKSLARYVGRDQPRNVQISGGRAKTGHLGIYDPNILCRKCDQVLGKLDDVAANLCRNFDRDHVRKPGQFFVCPRIDASAISKFALSVLWRCSVSTRREIEFKIPQYERIIKEILFDGRSMEDFAGLEIYLMAWKSGRYNTSQVFTYPESGMADDKEFFSFLLPRFRVSIMVSKIGTDPLILKKLAVNHNKVAMGFFARFEGSAEFRSMQRVARKVGHFDRGARRPSPRG